MNLKPISYLRGLTLFISQFLFHTRPSSSHQTWPGNPCIGGFSSLGQPSMSGKAMGKAVRNMIYIDLVGLPHLCCFAGGSVSEKWSGSPVMFQCLGWKCWKFQETLSLQTVSTVNWGCTFTLEKWPNGQSVFNLSCLVLKTTWRFQRYEKTITKKRPMYL